MSNNSNATTNAKAAKKSLMAEMRPVLVKAHGAEYCNQKAINKEMCVGSGISTLTFDMWCTSVEKLRVVVCEYVDLKHKVDRPEDSVINKARTAIFPKWKEVLCYGEKDVDTKELRASEDDISSLVGYAEEFMKSSRGTQMCHSKKNQFRKKVEALIGCRIAKNDVLTDSDRDLIKQYESAKKTVSESDAKIKALTTAISKLEEMKAKAVEKNEAQFVAYLDEQINCIKDEQSDIRNSKKEAEGTISNIGKSAKETLEKLNTIK